MLSHKDKLHKNQIHLDTVELANCAGSGRSMCAAKYVQDSMCIYISYNEYSTIYTLQCLQSYSLNMFYWSVFLNHGALFWQRESTCHYLRTARPTQITAQLRASIAERLERALDFGKLEAQQSERWWYGFIWFHLICVIIVCAFINVLQCISRYHIQIHSMHYPHTVRHISQNSVYVLLNSGASSFTTRNPRICQIGPATQISNEGRNFQLWKTRRCLAA